ncbi:MAG: hypothetical protein E7Z63_00920 [Thermoplasmata archaeon]|nr:hypothetical protein [Thermoplasmata archaeon]
MAKKKGINCVGIMEKKGDKIYVYNNREWRKKKGINSIQHRRLYKADGLAPTITSSQSSDIKVTEDMKSIRRMTPRETWRAMGFSRRKAGGGWDDRAFDKASEVGVSNQQLQRQAGNSIAVPVMTEIMRNIKTFDERPKTSSNKHEGRRR